VKKERSQFSRRTFLSALGTASLTNLFQARLGLAAPHTPASAPADARAARAARHARKISSPQWKNGKFQNGLPEVTNFSSALSRLIFSDSQRTPEEDIPTRKRTQQDFEQPPTTGFRVTWLGHSTLLVELNGQRFLTDPVWGERASPVSFAGPKRFFPVPLALSELPKLDAVVISHDHYDHLCRETIEALAKIHVPFIVPLGVGDRLEEMGVDFRLIHECDWWDEIKWGDITLACVPARHFSGRTPFDRNSTLWCGWVFAGAQQRFYFSGDTAYFPEFKSIGEKYGPFDVVAMESAAYNSAWPDVHIGPEQALQAFLELKGKIYLPIHWATFSLSTHSWTEPGERLLVGAKKLNIELVLPRPGESVEPARLDPQLKKKWWPDVAWESAEEAPVKSSGLP
jgi:L-ascorbate metabolism protein UlaG (beta-lactamase superfamily)